jgi:hypothetical protein
MPGEDPQGMLSDTGYDAEGAHGLFSTNSFPLEPGPVSDTRFQAILIEFSIGV